MAQTVARSEEDAYKARYPVFTARPIDNTLEESAFSGDNPFGSLLKQSLGEHSNSMGVDVTEIIESEAPVESRYQPGHPYADENGYVYLSNVNTIDEMADMISASRSFQMNVEIANTAKSMMQRLITLGQ